MSVRMVHSCHRQLIEGLGVLQCRRPQVVLLWVLVPRPHMAVLPYGMCMCVLGALKGCSLLIVLWSLCVESSQHARTL